MTSRTDSRIAGGALPRMVEFRQASTAITPPNPTERCFNKILFVFEHDLSCIQQIVTEEEQPKGIFDRRERLENFGVVVELALQTIIVFV